MVWDWRDWECCRGSCDLNVCFCTLSFSEGAFGEVGYEGLFFSWLTLTLNHGDMV